MYVGGSMATIILENPEMLSSKHYAKDKLSLKLTNGLKWGKKEQELEIHINVSYILKSKTAIRSTVKILTVLSL